MGALSVDVLVDQQRVLMGPRLGVLLGGGSCLPVWSQGATCSRGFQLRFGLTMYHDINPPPSPPLLALSPCEGRQATIICKSTYADAPLRALITSLKLGLHATFKNTLYGSAIVLSASDL